MAAVRGSAGWSPGTAGAGGQVAFPRLGPGAGREVPCLGLRSSFPPGHDRTPVPIPGPASTVSPRLGDPQWPLPHRPAGKRPTVQGAGQGGRGLVAA